MQEACQGNSVAANVSPLDYFVQAAASGDFEGTVLAEAMKEYRIENEQARKRMA